MNHEEEWYDRHHISKQYKNTHGTFYMLFIDNTEITHLMGHIHFS